MTPTEHAGTVTMIDEDGEPVPIGTISSLALALAYHDAVCDYALLHGDGTGRPYGIINIETPPPLPDVPLKVSDEPGKKPQPFYQTIRSTPRKRGRR